jgi:transcriptional regulator with XRE-family HTH domain
MRSERSFLITFGLRVRAIRSQRGMTQEALAAEAGFDRTYISLIERGQRNASLLNICRLAAALKVTPSCLLEGTSSEAK